MSFAEHGRATRPIPPRRRGRRRVWLIRHASDSPLNSDLRKSDTLEHFYATELPASQIILGVECGGFQNV
ncbi:MAG TPA: hypothetical protein VKA15_02005, partial [Isosphaeraceae bacterium]|nr:hypothetical protein [Isosphaeraceae bacterium]